MKILVVDDDTLIRKWMTLLLEQSAKTLEILQAETALTPCLLFRKTLTWI